MVTATKNGPKRTEKITNKITNSKLIGYLPWILALIFAICLALNSLQAATRISLDYLTCDKNLMNEFSIARYAFLMDRNNNNNKNAYKTTIDKINQKINHQADPTCVYAKIKYFIDIADYTNAQEEFKLLTKLYDQGKLADSRYLAVDSFEQLRNNLSNKQNLVPATDTTITQP